MRIAVPSDTADGLLSMRSGHFGHCAYFTICTIEDGKIVNTESVKNVDHDAVGCGGVIDYALSLNLDGIIAAGMGMPPFMRFTEGGLDVYIDQVHPLAGDAVRALIEGNVPRMDPSQVCRH